MVKMQDSVGTPGFIIPDYTSTYKPITSFNWTPHWLIACLLVHESVHVCCDMFNSSILPILLMWRRIPVPRFCWVNSSHRYIPLVMGLAHCKKEPLVHGVLSLLGSTRKWSWHLLSVSCCCILYLKNIAIHALVFLSKYLLWELSNYPFVE